MKGSKHIKVNCSFIRENMQAYILQTHCLHNDHQLDDIFTKSLPNSI